MSTAREFAFTAFALLCIAIILCGTGQMQAQEPAFVLLEPQTLSLDQGQISSVVVRIEGAVDVYGVQIELSFDAGKIKVLDVDESKTAVQITPGDFLALDKSFEIANEVDNETGQLTYAQTLLAPAESASGSGTLVEFEVEALETSSIDLLLGSVILASPEGALLPVQVVDDQENDSGIIVPLATATPIVTTGDSTATIAPTAEDVQTPTAEAPAEAAPATASPITQDTRLPAATESAALVATGSSATRAVPVQATVEEAEPAPIIPPTSEPAKTDQAAEIAAAPLPVEQEDSNQIEAQPSPALTVIGQNRNPDDYQAQPATPAPAAESDGIMEGPYVAIGLLLLIVALIAIWFLRRLLVGTK